jgi:hypothetical protein
MKNCSKSLKKIIKELQIVYSPSPFCGRRVFRPDGKAIVMRGDLKITPPQNRQVILQVVHGTTYYLTNWNSFQGRSEKREDMKLAIS